MTDETNIVAARQLFARFCPGGRVGGDNWRTLLAHVVPGKDEASFTNADWRRVQAEMRRTLAEFPNGYPETVMIAPSPFCVWYANAHGFPAE